MRDFNAEDRVSVDVADLLRDVIPRFVSRFFDNKKIAKRIAGILKEYVERKIDERISWRKDLMVEKKKGWS